LNVIALGFIRKELDFKSLGKHTITENKIQM